MEQIEDDNFDDEAKKALEKHGSFLACMFEKTEMVTTALSRLQQSSCD